MEKENILNLPPIPEQELSDWEKQEKAEASSDRETKNVARDMRNEIAEMLNVSYERAIETLVRNYKSLSEQREITGESAKLLQRVKNNLEKLFPGDTEKKMQAILELFGILKFSEIELQNFPLRIVDDFQQEDSQGALLNCLEMFKCCCKETYQTFILIKFVEHLKQAVLRRRSFLSHREIIDYQRELVQLLMPCMDFVPNEKLAGLPERLVYEAGVKKLEALEGVDDPKERERILENAHWIELISMLSTNDFGTDEEPVSRALEALAKKRSIANKSKKDWM